MPGDGRFHPMPRAERAALAFLILFAAVCLLPVWRTWEAAGMALSGWLMAALMVISPIVTLWVFRRGGR